eukprot:TRINITY_DN6565_c0_g1_i2.p1 TRINITY_DN6565_c0_g1~~TRINITY_DN6565_c0_g1_i2.p1  ORF type:complete len:281 (+),score=22.71 TRINITY_DN6565_c0_g1_i2:61-843(+)
MCIRDRYQRRVHGESKRKHKRKKSLKTQMGNSDSASKRSRVTISGNPRLGEVVYVYIPAPATRDVINPLINQVSELFTTNDRFNRRYVYVRKALEAMRDETYFGDWTNCSIKIRDPEGWRNILEIEVGKRDVWYSGSWTKYDYEWINSGDGYFQRVDRKARYAKTALTYGVIGIGVGIELLGASVNASRTVLGGINAYHDIFHSSEPYPKFLHRDTKQAEDALDNLYNGFERLSSNEEEKDYSSSYRYRTKPNPISRRRF